MNQSVASRGDALEDNKLYSEQGRQEVSGYIVVAYSKVSSWIVDLCGVGWIGYGCA